jgi:hypothetical protein
MKITLTGTGFGYGDTTVLMIRSDSTHYYYDFDVPPGDGTGTITFSCESLGHCPIDLAGNEIIHTPTSGATFIVDNTAPTAT